MDKGRKDAEEAKKTGSATGVHEYPGTQDAQNIQESLSEIARQVWSLTEGAQAINDPFSGKHYSLPFLPATPSSPSWTLEGLFELT